MKADNHKIHLILNAVSLAICLAGFGYSMINAPTSKVWRNGAWVFGAMSVFWICLIIARVHLHKKGEL